MFEMERKNKAIPVTGRGGIQVCFLSGTYIIYIWKSKAIAVTGREGMLHVRYENHLHIKKVKLSP
jgi:hypothetical protein